MRISLSNNYFQSQNPTFLTHFQAVAKVQSQLHEEPYTREELSKILEMNESDFGTQCLSPNTQNLQKFHLHQVI